MDSPLVHSFSQSGAVGQLIMLTLFALSILTWGVIAKKIKDSRDRKKQNESFLTIFRRNSHDLLSIQTHVKSESPIAEIFKTGIEQLADLIEEGSDAEVDSQEDDAGVAVAQKVKANLNVKQVVIIEESLERKITEELMKLDQFNVILAITAAAGPLLGLLGTVWGIMESFSSMGVAGNASIAVVAPGISSALVTTVAGLMVAIPALIAFNLINNDAKKQAVTMEIFAAEFLSIVKQKYLAT